MRRTLVLLFALLLVAPTWAGDASDPELSDPAGDQSETEPGPGDELGIGEDHDFADIDLIAAWISEVDDATFTISVQTSADLLANSALLVSFDVTKGNNSVFNSTADGATITLQSEGTAMTSGPATVSVTGSIATFTVLRADVGASGGDVLANLEVSSSRSEEAACAVVCAAQTGTDAATGARDYTLSRPAVVPGAALAFAGGTITENGTSTAASEETETFDANASLALSFTLTNSGTDADSYNLSLLAADALAQAGVNATLQPLNASLDPGETAQLNVTVQMTNATAKDHGIVVRATSLRGADAVAAMIIRVLEEEPPAPVVNNTAAPPIDEPPAPGRDPLIGEGTFLQDAAEGIGFDEAFDDLAELVFLALAVLLLVLLIFLIYFLAGARWVRVTVTPRRQTIAPGGTAEFQVQVRNRKSRFHDALAYFDGDANWRTGVLLRGDGAPKPLTRAGDETPLSLAGKEDSDGLTGTMRVQAPRGADQGETDAITLNVVPVDEDGHPRHRRAGKAKVTVRAEDPSVGPSGPDAIRMSSVTHQPEHPAAGEQVTTTAVLENDGEETTRMRVVLQLDGKDIEEETVEIPPKRARAVRFPWRAGGGANRVAVQVYKA